MKDKQFLIVIDLDGTALYDWQTLDEYTSNTLKKLINLGHQVVIATGRPYRASKKFYDQIGLNTPLINYNGALIHNPTDKNFEHITHYVPLNTIHTTFEEIGHLIDNAFCEHYDEIYLYRNDESIKPLLHDEGGKLNVGNFKDILDKDPNGFIIIAKKDNTDKIQEYLTDKFSNVLNHRNWGGEYSDIIEVYTPATCKSNAIKIVADYFNIPIERTIAFGDGDNDIEMIREAGLGVAMHNALESVKAVAKDHTLSNTEHGVADYLEKYFNLK